MVNMLSNNIKVSIIVPAYNVENFIERTITSCIEQTLKDLEVIVINDGSTDTTAKVIDQFKDNKSLRIIHQKNAGPNRVRQTGINLAKGRYISFVDGDDWIEPAMCESLFSFADQQDLEVVIFDAYRNFGNARPLQIVRDCQIDGIINGKEWTELLFKAKTFPSFCNKMFKAGLLKCTDFLDDIQFGEDLAVVPKIMLNAQRISKINETYYHYVQNPDSITKKDPGASFYQVYAAMYHLERFYSINLKDDKILKDYQTYKFYHIINYIYFEPIYDNKNYMLAFDNTLNEIKNLKAVPENLNITRKLILKYLSFKPNAKKLKRVINFIQNQKKILDYLEKAGL